MDTLEFGCGVMRHRGKSAPAEWLTLDGNAVSSAPRGTLPTNGTSQSFMVLKISPLSVVSFAVKHLVLVHYHPLLSGFGLTSGMNHERKFLFTRL